MAISDIAKSIAVTLGLPISVELTAAPWSKRKDLGEIARIWNYAEAITFLAKLPDKAPTKRNAPEEELIVDPPGIATPSGPSILPAVPPSAAQAAGGAEDDKEAEKTVQPVEDFVPDWDFDSGTVSEPGRTSDEQKGPQLIV